MRMRKLFSFNKLYRSVERDDESRGGDEGGLLQESSPKTLVLPPKYSTKSSSSGSNELAKKEGDTCPSTPDSFLDLIDGRKFDFASVPIEENDPLTTETAPIVAGGSNTTSDGPTRQAQKKKRRQSSLCEWPEDKMNEDLVEEAWQEPNRTKAASDESGPAKAPTPEHVVSGTIELKTKDQPSGITFQKTGHIFPLKIQGFSPFSQFKTKTDLKPGMVVLEINGRDMTWASTKEAVVEIKKAKPGKITITAIAPSKITSAPKALVDKISTPPTPIAVKKEKKEFQAKAKGDETLRIKNIWPPIQVQREGDGVNTTEQVETPGASKPSEPTHYRDPTLMMMDSMGTEQTEDTTWNVKTSDGPSFKELNPSVTTVDSTVTVDDAGTSSKQVIDNFASHPLDSKARMNSAKRAPDTLLGHLDNAVEMDVVYVSQDYSDEDDEIEPETNHPQPTNLDTAKQVNKANTNWDAKPPLPPKRAPSAPASATRRRPPSIVVDQAAYSAEETDSEGDEEEDGQGGLFLCDALDAQVIAPMLVTMKDVSGYAKRITERMPSWMRVICHE